MLPYALGQKLSFREGEGPVLEPIADNAGVARLDRAGASFRASNRSSRRCAGCAPRSVRRTALIGFAGAPWTVATYMVEGGASRDFRRVKGLGLS